MISVVIPTRNRLNSLNRVLDSLYHQTMIPSEIIIVDSSDQEFSIQDLPACPKETKLILKRTEPSVCNQRNFGISLSSAPYIVLSDDDLFFEKEYIFTLYNHLKDDPSLNVVSGIILEKNKKGEWDYHYDISSLSILYNWFFGLSIFADLSEKKFRNPILSNVSGHLLKKGNRISKGGWPIFVNWSDENIKFPFFSLMGAMIRKPKNPLFDPAFIYNGIGDNYDACITLGFTIDILKKTKAYHYKEPINRIQAKKAFYYRTAALHYIMLKHNHFTKKNQWFLIWSLLGTLIRAIFLMDREMIKYTTKLISQIIQNRNVYVN